MEQSECGYRRLRLAHLESQQWSGPGYVVIIARKFIVFRPMHKAFNMSYGATVGASAANSKSAAIVLLTFHSTSSVI